MTGVKRSAGMLMYTGTVLPWGSIFFAALPRSNDVTSASEGVSS